MAHKDKININNWKQQSSDPGPQCNSAPEGDSSTEANLPKAVEVIKINHNNGIALVEETISGLSVEQETRSCGQKFKARTARLKNNNLCSCKGALDVTALSGAPSPARFTGMRKKDSKIQL